MRGHLAKCSGFQLSIGHENHTKFLIRNNFLSSPDDISTITSVPSEVGPNSSSELPTQVPKLQRTIESFMDSMTVNEKNELDYLFAKFAHLSCSSFDPFGSAQGKAFLTRLRPAYMSHGGPPNREQVSGIYLIRHHNDIMRDVEALVRKSWAICVTQDGWTDVNSDGLKNIMCCCPFPFLMGSIRNYQKTEEVHNLVVECKLMVKKCLKIFEVAKFSMPSLVGFCTDNPNSNKAMRLEMMKDEELSSIGLVPYGCSCHALNNFGKDVCKLGRFEKLFQQAKVISSVFRNVKFAKFHLRSFQKKEYHRTYQILQHSETRWNSNIAVLQSILRSKSALLCVNLQSKHGGLSPPLNLTNEFSGTNSAGYDDEKVSVAAILDDTVFWSMLSQAIQLLKPVAVAISVLESDLTPVSMIAMSFVMLLRFFKRISKMNADMFPFSDLLLSPADFRDMEDHKSKTLPDLLRRRWNEITAHKVNPSRPLPVSGLFQLALWLDRGTQNIVVECLQENIYLDKSVSIPESIMTGASYLSDLLHRGNNFPDCNFDEYITSIGNEIEAAQEERSMRGRCSSKPLQCCHPLHEVRFHSGPRMIFIKHLFRLPPSAAGGERSFSEYGNTNTKKRNSMKNDNLDFLVLKVKFNRRVLDYATNSLSSAVREESVLKLFHSDDILEFEKGDDDLVCSDDEVTEDDDSIDQCEDSSGILD